MTSPLPTLWRVMSGALLGLALTATPAMADEADEADEQDEIDEESVTGQAPPTRARPDRKPALSPELVPVAPSDPLSMEEEKARPHAPVIYRGVDALNMEVDFIAETYKGSRMIFRREYKEAKQYWDALEQRWPKRGIQHVGAVLIYQSMMMENFDFRFEKQYQYHSDAAIKELSEQLEVQGNEAWERFLIGAMMGVESIHIMRRGDYVPALSRGVEAMRHIERCKELAPRFYDARLGDGLYKYWRSVVTMNSKVLPDFADERAEGIGEMELVQNEGIFLGPGATLALVFTHIEERELKQALDACMRNYKNFPNSVINNLVLSRVHMYLRKYDSSLKVLEEVLEDAPDNRRAHYYMATVHVRTNKYDQALASVNTYLEFELADEYRAQGLHRKGDVYYRQRDYDTAEEYYKKAVKLDNYKPSAHKIERIKSIRKKEKERARRR